MSTLRDVQQLANDPEVKPLLTHRTLDHKGEIVERSKQYLKKDDQEKWERDIRRDEAGLRDPMLSKKIVNAGRIKQQIERRKLNLSQQTPPPLTDAQRDKLMQLEKVSREYARDGMPSKQEIALGPKQCIGLTARLTDWNRAKKNAVLLWKNTMKLLHPMERDRELTNFERFRPDRPRTETSMIGGGKMFAGLGEGYDQIDWTTGLDGPKVEAKIVTESARKAKGDGPAKVYACEHTECEGQIFSGQIGKARWARHMKQAHGEVPREKTQVAMKGATA